MISKFSRWIVAAACVLPIVGWGETKAQVVSDGSLMNPTQVSQGGNGRFRITEGTQSGEYLFHSFKTFSIGAHESVLFVDPNHSRGIVARVTGGQASYINGLLRAQGQADVFFLNPKGITFGSQASLDLGGSLIVSTAKSLQFSNQQEFKAKKSGSAPPLLKISTPSGLQLGNNPKAIHVLGVGHGLEIDPDTLGIIPANRPNELLSTTANRTIALIGGQVNLEGGNLQASGGRIAIAALKEDQTVQLKPDDLGWKITVPTERLKDISLAQASSLVTSGNGGGNIQLIGRNVDILEGSTVLANSFGFIDGQGVEIKASEDVLITGVLLAPDGQTPIFPSSVFSEVGIDQDSSAGPITIEAQNLEISDGAQVSTSTLGFGNGGDITLNIKTLDIIGGTEELGASGLYLDVLDEFTEGNGGQLKIKKANQIFLSEGGLISASTFGPGNSGLIDIESEQLSIISGGAGLGASAILAQSESTGTSQGIKLDSDRITILSGAQISSSTFGGSEGGPINIKSQQIDLDGASPAGNPGGIFSSVEGSDQSGNRMPGAGGRIQVNTKLLSIKNGAEINSSTVSKGKAGVIEIQSDDIRVDAANNLSTGIFTAAEADSTGEGADLTLKTKRLVVQNGGQIAVGTLGEGKSGSLNVEAQQVILSGTNPSGRSGLFANAFESDGAGGDITVETEQLFITDGATVNVGNFPSVNSNAKPGKGPAGSVNIKADRILLNNQGRITASTAIGDRGDITLDAEVVALTNQSLIQTNTESSVGGNIFITSEQLIGTGNSDITANAARGFGGRVEITSDQVLGLEFRPQLTGLNDITASSQLGDEFDGTVEVDVVDPAPTKQNVLSSGDIVDSSRLISRSCLQRKTKKQGKFVVKGSGGVANQPYSSPASFFNTLNLEPHDADSTLTRNVSPQPLVQKEETQAQTPNVNKVGLKKSPSKRC